MKRIVLGGLLGCMLVGQVFGADNMSNAGDSLVPAVGLGCVVGGFITSLCLVSNNKVLDHVKNVCMNTGVKNFFGLKSSPAYAMAACFGSAGVLGAASVILAYCAQKSQNSNHEEMLGLSSAALGGLAFGCGAAGSVISLF